MHCVISCLVLLSLILGVSADAKAPVLPKNKLRRPKQLELLYPWVEKGETLTVKHLRTFVDWASLDPLADAIVKAAMQRFGAKDLDAFLPLFVVVDPDGPKPDGGNRRGGSTSYGTLDVDTIALESADRFSAAELASVEPYRSRIEEIRARHDAYFAYALNRGVELRVFTFAHPKVFLSAGESMRLSYESFIHELAHFTRFDLRTEPDPTAFESDDAYQEAYLLAPGQEVDARATGIKALFQLLREYPYETSLPVDMESWFTAKGDPKRGMDALLLPIRSFLGYNANGTWKNRLEVLVAEDRRELSAARELYPEFPAVYAERAARLRAEILRAERLLGGGK